MPQSSHRTTPHGPHHQRAFFHTHVHLAIHAPQPHHQAAICSAQCSWASSHAAPQHRSRCQHAQPAFTQHLSFQLPASSQAHNRPLQCRVVGSLSSHLAITHSSFQGGQFQPHISIHTQGTPSQTHTGSLSTHRHHTHHIPPRFSTQFSQARQFTQPIGHTFSQSGLGTRHKPKTPQHPQGNHGGWPTGPLLNTTQGVTYLTQRDPHISPTKSPTTLPRGWHLGPANPPFSHGGGQSFYPTTHTGVGFHQAHPKVQPSLWHSHRQHHRATQFQQTLDRGRSFGTRQILASGGPGQQIQGNPGVLFHISTRKGLFRLFPGYKVPSQKIFPVIFGNFSPANPQESKAPNWTSHRESRLGPLGGRNHIWHATKKCPRFYPPAQEGAKFSGRSDKNSKFAPIY